MKRQKLIKAIKEKGAAMVRQGGSHEIWESRNGYRFTVPRHTEIKENTAKAIIKQADK
ncbi:type II toxin-antitoxin system HicA family toxin [uncultured Desulfobacter sp.]|uniref:type II toxin-antitoxin system HicA family toxin n=1 Tax=uncultured Desulfobacter sp. TaxID=240139 RepID=UPI0029F57D56|nr:type II toxin-antitoxin system HicA family toxin [uncultured Desulfobacter sp.]